MMAGQAEDMKRRVTYQYIMNANDTPSRKG